MERLLDKLLDNLDSRFEKLPDWVLNHKLLVLVAFVLLILVAIPGVTQFGLQSGNDAYFGKQDPIKKAYDNFRLQFGSTDAIYVTYKAKDGDILSEQSLLALQGVQNDI